ncbi:hypothetical protein OQA88_7139 [Cercophora sp. LCS_1]
MHGPWHPILHNSPRPPKGVDGTGSGPAYTPTILNDYSWYRSLDTEKKEIRILFLEPEPIDSPKPVVVHVFNASLLADNVPRLYGCLSYCWGDPKVTKPIEINYTEKANTSESGLVTYQTKFNVTANLEAALRVLRSTLVRPVLWADALCIDQSDLGERATQVALMAEIYSQAVQTIVWLGEADSTTKMVFDFANLLADMQVKEVDPGAKAAGILCSRLHPLAKGQDQFTDEDVESDEFYQLRWGIQSLLARPFFRRAWVLQEVGLAIKDDIAVHCGPASLKWVALINLFSFEWRAAAYQGKVPIDLERNRRLSLPWRDTVLAPGLHYTLPEIWSYLRQSCSNNKRGNILELVMRKMEIQATDPRDQVFALLGLAKECQPAANQQLHQGFIPNYFITDVEVYIRFTKAVIEALGNVFIFSAVDTFNALTTREGRKLPSWVPEYDRQINLRQTFGFLGQGWYRASGNTKTVAEWPQDGTMTIKGVHVDWIGEDLEWGPFELAVETDNLNDLRIVPRLRITEHRGEGIKFLWRVTNARISQNPVPDQDLIETFILTLIASRKQFFNRELIRSVLNLPELTAEFAAYWLFCHGNFESLPASSSLYRSHKHLHELASTGQAARFGQRLFYTCDKRSFVVTQRGLLGLVPKNTTTLDQVVVFHGGNVPFVVRETSSPSTTGWNGTLVGECYLHGIMRGSTMVQIVRNELKWANFCLH